MASSKAGHTYSKLPGAGKSSPQQTGVKKPTELPKSGGTADVKKQGESLGPKTTKP